MNLWENTASGILFISCKLHLNSESDYDYSPWWCNSLRLYTIMIIFLFYPMGVLLKRQWALKDGFFQKDKLLVLLIMTSNFVYFLNNMVVNVQGVYYISLICRMTASLALLHVVLTRAALLADDYFKCFWLANYLIAIVWVLSLIVIFLLMMFSHAYVPVACRGVLDPIIIVLGTLEFLVTFMYLGVVLLLRRTFSNGSYFNGLAEYNKKQLATQLQNLLNYTIVLGLAHLLRLGRSIYRNLFEDIDDACLFPKNSNQVVNALILFVYSLLTYYLPIILMLRVLWVHDDQFAFHKNNMRISAGETEVITESIQNFYGKLSMRKKEKLLDDEQ